MVLSWSLNQFHHIWAHHSLDPESSLSNLLMDPDWVGLPFLSLLSSLNIFSAGSWVTVSWSISSSLLNKVCISWRSSLRTSLLLGSPWTEHKLWKMAKIRQSPPIFHNFDIIFEKKETECVFYKLPTCILNYCTLKSWDDLCSWLNQPQIKFWWGNKR